MQGKVQGIKHSEVGGHHHNGVSNNAINNLVRVARTMMIHTALRWTNITEKSLCTMDMYHSVHLHNHTRPISIGLYPDEIWRRSKSSHSALHNNKPYV